MTNCFAVTVSVLKGGVFGDKQEFTGVLVLDLLVLDTHLKTGALGDNNDCSSTFSLTLILKS